MSFHEIRFPDDIAFGSSGGPEYSTDIVETFSGHEQRNINWSQSRAKYNATHGVKTPEQLDELRPECDALQHEREAAGAGLHTGRGRQSGGL